MSFSRAAIVRPPASLLLAGAVAVAILLAAPGVGGAGGTSGQVAELVVSGRGVGDGAGLSQWGAEERAAAGQSYRRILSFYYPGTRIGTTLGTTVRVLVREAPVVRVGSRTAFAVRDARGETVHMRAGLHRVGPDGLGAVRLVLPLRVSAGVAPLQVGGTRYRGTFVVSRETDGYRVVDVVGLEDYVQGVVTSECPGTWPQQALRAQAVASRSYVLANRHPERAFDVYADSRSQNYRGLSRAYPSATAAAGATRHEVLRYDGRIADAVFSASNGGMTSDGSALLGRRLPYLVDRVDPFDARSPVSAWGPVRVSLSQLRTLFPAVPSELAGVTAVADGGDRVALVRFVDVDGVSVDTSGFMFQQRLGLRSTYLTVTTAYAAAATG